MSTHADVIKAVAVMAELHQRKMSPELALMYCSDLAAYPPSVVLDALSRCRRELRAFPTIADVLERISGVRPPDEMDAARAVAGSIISAIGSVGYYRPRSAEEKLGPLAWAVVQRVGGWRSLCENLSGENITTWQAQLRDLALSLARQSAAGTLDRPAELPQPPSQRAIEMAAGVLKRIT